ncbi:TPA: glycosyltransferase family 8 protein, partial [Campylobacter jejuni]|nr:glycosyltransferase family 8 protein [Campylobacter jejuni]
SYYGIQKYRTFGTIGERLFGIYIMYLKENKFKVSERPLIFITYPKRQRKLIPFFNKNQITIVSNFNNEYVPVYTSFLISSLEKLSKDNKYEYIILSQDISNTNKLILEKLVEEYNMYLNIKITFYDPFIYLDRIKLFVDNPVYSKDLYVRIIIPYILSEYDKVIVIDCDTICNVDLSELYSIDLKNCILGAVKDVVLLGWLNDKLKDSLQYYKTILKNPYNYCNTGILLFNCSKARDKYTLEYILNCIEKSNYRIYEQDMINVLYQQDIYFLDEGWNVYTYSNAFIEQSIKLAPLKNYLAYINARKNPKIIHFAGHPKPWWVDCDFDIEFWKYARKSPYYEHLLHIKNWHLVNHMLLNNFKLSVKYRKKIVKFFFPIGSRRRIVYEIYKKLFK